MADWTDTTIVERIKAQGVAEGIATPVDGIRDVFRVVSTLLGSIDGSRYCWCNAYPCECIAVFMDDLTECLIVRHPGLDADAKSSNSGSEGRDR